MYLMQKFVKAAITSITERWNQNFVLNKNHIWINNFSHYTNFQSIIRFSLFVVNLKNGLLYLSAYQLSNVKFSPLEIFVFLIFFISKNWKADSNHKKKKRKAHRQHQYKLIIDSYIKLSTCVHLLCFPMEIVEVRLYLHLEICYLHNTLAVITQNLNIYKNKIFLIDSRILVKWFL